MAPDPTFVVRVEKKSGDTFGGTMKVIRNWLAHRHIQPASFKPVANARSGVGFEIGFNKKDEAHLFEQAFRAKTGYRIGHPERMGYPTKPQPAHARNVL